MTPLKKVCFIEKGYDIDDHIKKANEHYPHEFTIVEIDIKDVDFEKQYHTKKKVWFDIPSKEWRKKITEPYKLTHDIASMFYASWNQPRRGVHLGKEPHEHIEFNMTDRKLPFYEGTAWHEDLHTYDNIIKKYGGVDLATIARVDDWDDDVVHNPSWKYRVFYKFDDYMELVAPYLSHALAVKRARLEKKRPTPEYKPIHIAPEGIYTPPNFSIKELVSPDVLNRLGEEVCWQMFDERALKNLQWLRNRFGVTYVNIPGRFQYRGFDAGEYRTSGTSQHNHGRAIDMHFRDYSIPQVLAILETEHVNMPEPNVWIEWTVNGKTPTWLHMDVRYSAQKGLVKFNA